MKRIAIARLSVPYGDNGGWPWYHLLMMKAGVEIPIHPDPPGTFNPIHEDDIVAMVPRLLEAASVPAIASRASATDASGANTSQLVPPSNSIPGASCTSATIPPTTSIQATRWA